MITIPEFIDMAETVVRDHTPYVLGGVSLTHGCDCSGMIYGARVALGLPPGPRTTQEMYATWGFIPIGQQRVGDLPIFDVPSDGGSAPQHIGLYLGGALMIEEPHTGTFGTIEDVPNSPGERLMGYLRMPDVVPLPPVPPTQEENETMYVLIIGPQTHVYAVVNNVVGHWWQLTAGPDFTWHPEALPAP